MCCPVQGEGSSPGQLLGLGARLVGVTWPHALARCCDLQVHDSKLQHVLMHGLECSLGSAVCLRDAAKALCINKHDARE